jgi:hypothetical protein
MAMWVREASTKKVGRAHHGRNMTAGITITPMEQEWFGVQLDEGDTTWSYKVQVPPALLDDLGLVGIDLERVIRESFAFLLEREPPSSILREFPLDVIPRYFPEYQNELPRRLGRWSGTRQCDE